MNLISRMWTSVIIAGALYYCLPFCVCIQIHNVMHLHIMHTYYTTVYKLIKTYFCFIVCISKDHNRHSLSSQDPVEYVVDLGAVVGCRQQL